MPDPARLVGSLIGKLTAAAVLAPYEPGTTSAAGSTWEVSMPRDAHGNVIDPDKSYYLTVDGDRRSRSTRSPT